MLVVFALVVSTQARPQAEVATTAEPVEDVTAKIDASVETVVTNSEAESVTPADETTTAATEEPKAATTPDAVDEEDSATTEPAADVTPAAETTPGPSTEPEGLNQILQMPQGSHG